MVKNNRKRACQSAPFRWVACAVAILGSTPARGQTATEIVLHNFGNPPSYIKGAGPYAGLFRTADGSLYGTTVSGGAANAGVVYRVDTMGHETVLYSFTGGADGGNPYSAVVRDAAGNLYGTTANGGVGFGVVYKLDTAGHQTVLYSFTGGADGTGPSSGVISDTAGNLYGVTSSGGTSGAGTVFMVDVAGARTVLYTFSGGADGAGPNSLIRDGAGTLFGTTASGGVAKMGVVYKLDTAGNQTVLYYFVGGTTDGATPNGIARDSAGNLYGTTTYGGGYLNFGTVWKVDPLGREKVIYSFSGYPLSGANPITGVVLDAAGNLYGTTQGVGSPLVVYKIGPAGVETVLYRFSGTDVPDSGVVLDSAGDLYGTTYGSALGSTTGVVYKLDPTGQETILCNFAAPPPKDGYGPTSGLILDAARNLYGTTPYGGTMGVGTIYKLDAAGQETVLHDFAGDNPASGVTPDSAGNIYGTAYGVRFGMVYKLDATGHETVLHGFTGHDGNQPTGGVVLDAAGNLYGATTYGGQLNYGVVYKLDPAGHETVLHSFGAGSDGRYPYSGVIRDTAGRLYGTTTAGGTFGHGVVYEISTAGNETVLHNFGGGYLGDYPYAGLILDAAGNLYGTTLRGGVANIGLVYAVNAHSGAFTVLHSFTGSTDGAGPYAGPIRDAAGNLYGTTSGGGASGNGVVYMIDGNGNETVLYSFKGGADGAGPLAPVIFGPDGTLYGTTSAGGTKSGGVVFALKIPAAKQ